MRPNGIEGFDGGLGRARSSSRDAARTMLAELDAALFEGAKGAEATRWRKLQAEVRQLAPAIDPACQQRLSERLVDLRAAGTRIRGAGTSGRIRRLRSRMGSQRIPAGAPLLATTLAVLAVALVIVAPWGGVGNRRTTTAPGAQSSGASKLGAHVGARAGAESSASAAPLTKAPSAAPEESSAGGGQEAAPGAELGRRLQQLGASITLGPKNDEVQAVSDAVARIAGNDGGFVQRSHVGAQSGRRSEAELILNLPSGRLAATIAALDRLAPVSAESQSLQDVTSSFDAARARLREARSERASLLRALAAATTEEEVGRLRARIGHAHEAIERDEGAARSISRRASRAELEVSVLGSHQAASSRGTVGAGLHDALDVLRVALAVVLVAAAVLVPLGLVLLVAYAALRALRRYRRESALDGP